MVIDRVIISRHQVQVYRDQGYQIARCPFPGKLLAIFWVPASA